MKQYKDYMDEITVSDELHENIMQKAQEKPRGFPVRRLAAMAAGLVIVAGGVFAAQQMTRQINRMDMLYAADLEEHAEQDRVFTLYGRPDASPTAPPQRNVALPPAYDQFAWVLQRGTPLAVITVFDDDVTTTTTTGSAFVSQRARTDQILLQGTALVQLPQGEFTLNTGTTQTPAPGTYLAFIWGNEREFSFLTDNAARINDDGTITPLPGEDNVFAPLAGMTVEEILELLDLAN